jgi:hypothetical protein
VFNYKNEGYKGISNMLKAIEEGHRASKYHLTITEETDAINDLCSFHEWSFGMNALCSTQDIQRLFLAFRTIAENQKKCRVNSLDRRKHYMVFSDVFVFTPQSIGLIERSTLHRHYKQMVIKALTTDEHRYQDTLNSASFNTPLEVYLSLKNPFENAGCIGCVS